MYDYIKGSIASKILSPNTYITLDNNGIGYKIIVNKRTINKLPELESEVKIYVTLIHKEDSMFFVGFENKNERDIFDILQSVSGVGTKVALVLLNDFSDIDLISALAKEDYKTLCTAKGIGPKLAKKIILELKDKLINWQNTKPIKIDTNIKEDITAEIEEAQAVLLSLGYSLQEAQKALKFACNSKDEKLTSEIILRNALTYLAQ